MLAFLGTGIGKFLLGLLMPIVVGAVRKGVGDVWEKIPSWMRPLVSSVMGAAAGAAVAASTGVVSTETVLAGAAVGAVGGATGKADRDAVNELMNK